MATLPIYIYVIYNYIYKGFLTIWPTKIPSIKKTLVRNYKMYLPTKFQTQNKGVKAFNLKKIFFSYVVKNILYIQK